jgi:CubicO group peptidase (beta-lactamase class C family)
MFAAQAPLPDEDYHYGLGWFVETDDQGRRRVWHTGGAMGGSGVLLFYPERDLVVATLANAGDVPHFDLAQEMARRLIEGAQ